jgi:hypothetical protein
MTCIRWSLALLGVCLGTAEVQAQGLLVWRPSQGYGTVTTGRSFTYGRARRHGGLAFSIGSFGTRGGVFGPLWAPSYRYYTGRQVTVLYYSPPAVVLLPQPASPLDELPPDILPRNRLEARPPERDMPGEEAGGFRPLDPDNRARARRALPPPPPERPKPPPEEPRPLPPKEEQPLPPPRAEPPRPPRHEDDPAAEYARLIVRGRAAFAAAEYGRAAQRFRQAAALAPDEPQAHFLLAQALLALGKYREGRDAVHAGMARKPDWPLEPFRPVELYGPHAVDYPDHLRRLEGALTRHPDDPVLLFLYAYALWFDGRKEEARPLFRRARPGAADRGVIDRFLRAQPAAAAV